MDKKAPLQIRTSKPSEKFSVSKGKDNGNVTFLHISDTNGINHSNIEIDRWQAIQLRNYLNKFINGELDE